MALADAQQAKTFLPLGGRIRDHQIQTRQSQV